jgi:hypothetical protein
MPIVLAWAADVDVSSASRTRAVGRKVQARCASRDVARVSGLRVPSDHTAPTAAAQLRMTSMAKRTLMTGVEHLTDRQRDSLDKHPPAGDPNGEVRLRGTPANASERSTSNRVLEPAGGSPSSSGTSSTPGRSGASPDSAGRCGSGGSDPGLLRHRRRRHSRNRSNRRPHREEPPLRARVQETSRTTDYAFGSLPTERGPTEPDLPMLDPEQPAPDGRSSLSDVKSEGIAMRPCQSVETL